MKPRPLILLFVLLAIYLAACAAAGGASRTEPVLTPPPSQESQTQPPANPSATPTPIESAAPLPFPGDTPVLVWHREGGIAGFCDDLSVNADGSFTVTTCVALPNSQKTGHLDAGQFGLLAGWVNRFQSFDTSLGQDDTFPDAMITKTTFKGVGAAQPAPQDLVAINNFASFLVSPPQPVGDDGQPRAVSKARDFLAGELNIAVAGIDVVSFEFVEWPDRCLGVIVIGQMCAMGVTPGYRIVLQAQSQLYELHTDETGDSIRMPKNIP